MLVGCASPPERSARRIAQPIPSVLASDAKPRCASMASADRQMIGDATPGPQRRESRSCSYGAQRALTEQGGGLEQQHDQQQADRHRLLVLGTKEIGAESAEQAKQRAAHEGAGVAAES